MESKSESAILKYKMMNENLVSELQASKQRIKHMSEKNNMITKLITSIADLHTELVNITLSVMQTNL